MDQSLLRTRSWHPDTWTDVDLPLHSNKPQTLLATHNADLFKLLEVHVEDFIGVVHSDGLDVLRHATRAMLHGIHSVFPPSANAEDDPVSHKKLLAGDGVWAARKEILGWMFDGLLRTMALPPEKVTKLLDALSSAISRKSLPLKEFRTLPGKLQQGFLAMPAGKSILTPSRKFVEAHKQRRILCFPKQPLIPHRKATSRPTHVHELVPNLASYIAGGLWLDGSKNLHPVVWRLAWPADIAHLLHCRWPLARWQQEPSPGRVAPRLACRHRRPPRLAIQPEGDITINDLEMAGLLLQCLVLEMLVPLKHEHVAAWCDNTSTVSWARRMTSSRSRIGHRLVRALMMRINVNEASPLVTVLIQGCRNDMGDVVSRSFGPAGKALAVTFDSSNPSFLNSFNSQFPLDQDDKELSTKVSSLVCSELQGEPQSMDSWRRLTRKGNPIGRPGPNGASIITWTPSSAPTTPPQPPQPCRPSLHVSDREASAEGGKLALKLFKSRHVPLARTSNWTLGPTRATATAQRPSTGRPSNNKWKAAAARTPSHKPSLLFPSASRDVRHRRPQIRHHKSPSHRQFNQRRLLLPPSRRRAHLPGD
jgi:hypothetical protein